MNYCLKILSAFFFCFATIMAFNAGAGEISPVGWRGDGTGRFPEARPPLKWSRNPVGRTENILWQAEMPADAPSSPIVVGNRVFTTVCNYDLVCVDKDTGKILWVRTASPYDAVTVDDRAKDPDTFKELDALAAERDKLLARIPALEPLPAVPATQAVNAAKTAASSPATVQSLGAEKAKIDSQMDTLLRKVDNKKFAATEAANYGYAAATPASDGERVYAVNAMGVVACWDLDGNRKWIAYDHAFHQHHGYHTSPAIAGDNVVVFLGDYKAYDRKTGRVSWTTNETGILRYGSPVVTSHGGEQLIVSCSGWLFRAKDGALVAKNAIGELWGSPAVGNGRICLAIPRPYAGNNWRPVAWYDMPTNMASPSALSIHQPDFPLAELLQKDWGGTGPVVDPADKITLDTKTWETLIGKVKVGLGQLPTIQSSPLVHDGLAYVLTMAGVLLVYDLDKCELVYKKFLDLDINRAGSRPYGDGLNASPAFAGGKIFIPGNTGTILVIEPGREYKEVSRNKIVQLITWGYRNNLQEGTMGSPFFDGRRIYLRAQRFLYCIGEK